MKNKHTLPILLLLSVFLISGCSGGNKDAAPDGGKEPVEPSGDGEPVNPKGSDYFNKDVTLKMNGGVRTSETSIVYDLSFKYDEECFTKSAKTYDKDLSMISFGASLVSINEERGEAFYKTLEYQNITTHGYDEAPTEDSIGYFIAHKTIEDFELVTLSFRGFDYQKEWVNNFVIGKTGNHAGFDARGQEVYQELQYYISDYCANKTLKLWINGYSRAGALSNVLASYILKGEEISVTQDNMFVYTFEAPASLSEENAIAYENVHNVINNADLITFIPPTNYGLARCGVDYPIYNANVSTLIKELDQEIVIPEYVSSDTLEEEGVTDDITLCQYAVNAVFNNPTIGDDVAANTREQYVDGYQEGLSGMIGYIFMMKPTTLTQMFTDLQNLGLGALSIIGDDTGAAFMEFFKPYLDQDEIEYDEAKLLGECATFIKGVQNLFFRIILLFLTDQGKADLTRLIDMHYPETTYVLLKTAHSVPAE